LPSEYLAEASFLVGSCEQGMPATSLLSRELIDRSLDQVGWRESSGQRPVFDMLVQGDGADHHQVTVTARCQNPSDASLLAMTVAENLVRGPFVRQEAPAALADAEQQVREADTRYREALADWGRESNALAVSSPADEIVQTKGAAPADAEIFTAPAILSPERAAKKSLVETALLECMSRRQRMVDLYTQEHPSVVALDRQIIHLQSLLASEMPAPMADARISSSVPAQTADSSTEDRATSAELAARREQVEQLALARESALQALQEVRTVSAEGGATLPEVLSAVVPGPRGLREVGSSKTSFFIGWTALVVVAASLVEGLALARASLSSSKDSSAC
jgi:hypothetical protein